MTDEPAMTEEPTVLIFEAPLGSDLYAQAVHLREAVLRAPLGLTVSPEERLDDAMRQHFCAVSFGRVVGTVSLHPFDEVTLHLMQMAVSETDRNVRVGAKLLAYAETWGTEAGFRVMLADARVGAEGFYLRFGYAQEGGPFEKHTIPHVRVVKRLG
ncbi:MAG TPA: GNAT family N-acetyltransferase [Hyphomicrobiales bacterium]|nr:GNAT family N-acetyltransferase [Hyphomicrobiales bacterium]